MMRQSAPQSLSGFLFSETELRDWGDAGNLFAKPAGELTDDEIERLLTFRRQAAQRMQGVGAVLAPLRDTLQRLVGTLNDIISQASDGDAAQSLLRLSTGAGQNLSPQ